MKFTHDKINLNPETHKKLLELGYTYNETDQTYQLKKIVKMNDNKKSLIYDIANIDKNGILEVNDGNNEIKFSMDALFDLEINHLFQKNSECLNL